VSVTHTRCDTLRGMRSSTARTLVLPLAVAVLLAGCSSDGDDAAQAPASDSATVDGAEPAEDSQPEAFPPVNGAEVSVEDFQAHMNDDGTTILDVRTPEEFAEGHIEGAVNIDHGSPGFGDIVGELDKDATYAVYCRSDNRSGQAVQRMLSEGFTDLYHLDGGIIAWAEAGNEVVTG
jgi:phage shock protein E